CVNAHSLSQTGIDDQRTNSAREIIDIMCLGDQTVLIVLYQLFGPAGVGNNDRNAGSLRFDDDVAKSVRSTRKSKDISRSIGGGEFDAGQIPSKNCIG